MPGFMIDSKGGTLSSTTEVYRNYRWELKSITGGVNISEPEILGMALDLTVPSLDFEIMNIQGMSLEYKIPKKPIFNNIDITFYDAGSLQDKFEEWMDLIWNPEKGLYNGAAPTNIKGQILMDFLEADGTASKSLEINGAWPKRMTHSKLDMASDTLKTVIVEFVYDFYVLKHDAKQLAKSAAKTAGA